MPNRICRPASALLWQASGERQHCTRLTGDVHARCHPHGSHATRKTSRVYWTDTSHAHVQASERIAAAPGQAGGAGAAQKEAALCAALAGHVQRLLPASATWAEAVWALARCARAGRRALSQGSASAPRMPTLTRTLATTRSRRQGRDHRRTIWFVQLQGRGLLWEGA